MFVYLQSMQKANKIAAFFFLGLFGLMMLHQAFPHLHHQHQDSHSHSHSDVAHTGEHHHHDNGSHEDEESPYGFFGFFMDMHVHSTVSTDIIVERQIVEHRTDTNENVVKTYSGFQELYFIDKRRNNDPPLYHPPNHYFNPFLSSLDLRGPPSLG